MPSQYFFDSLEPRKLFAVTLDGAGVLNIIGTAHGDKVDVYAEPKNHAKLDVKLNGQVTQFDRADVQSLFIRTFRGRDIVHVGDSRPQYALDDKLPSRIYADAGDDVVMVYSGKSHVFGGDGDDLLSNELDHAPTTVYGEGGNDLLHGGWNNDLLVGGAGNDHLAGMPGTDTLDGGDGNDTLDAGVGDANASVALAGNDKLYGGAGQDSVGVNTNPPNDLLDRDGQDVPLG